MPSSSSASSSHAVEVVHCPSTSPLPHEPQLKLVSEFASFSTTLSAGYKTPTCYNGVVQTILSSLKHEKRAFPAHPDRTMWELDRDLTAFHHGGSTSDLGAVITWATMKWPKSKIYIIGTSLGGVITGKTLGQWGEACPVSAAALVSPVYDFPASCKAMETNLVSRTVFNPAVGAFYSNLVKKNKDAFDLEHWRHTRPTPFPPAIPSPCPSVPFSPSLDPELVLESQPFGQESRNGSFMTSSTRSTSIFSSVPSPSTPGTSSPPTPFSGSSSSCLPPPLHSVPVVTEHNPEIKDALAKSLKEVTSLLLPQPLTKFCKSFVASTAHFLSGGDFMAETSAVKDLPNIRVPCLAVNYADDPLMPGADLPRSEARQSPYFVMAVPKGGGHLGTFTTKRWKKKNGTKRYHTAVVEEWFKANEALPQLRPRPRIFNALQGFLYPEGHPEMAFRETTPMYLKLKYSRPTYPRSTST
ncbi:medium-chain fatty acid ethyl ester synthase/esterase 2 [Tulasnella sp. UAMH 9824]|nr:medium-chain fatty acid ethyl ester synthase/esterase 2 [Tulasnella sp. UAMH 9824]